MLYLKCDTDDDDDDDDDDSDDVLQLNVQMILSGKLRHVDKGIRSYQLYLEHLFKVTETTHNW